jgi:hypothetical protein
MDLASLIGATKLQENGNEEVAKIIETNSLGNILELLAEEEDLLTVHHYIHEANAIAKKSSSDPKMRKLAYTVKDCALFWLVYLFPGQVSISRVSISRDCELLRFRYQVNSHEIFTPHFPLGKMKATQRLMVEFFGVEVSITDGTLTYWIST